MSICGALARSVTASHHDEEEAWGSQQFESLLE
jgi:hypothetical protein